MRPNSCSAIYPAILAVDEGTESKYSTAQKGELALLRVLQRSLEKGWIASRPTRDCRYDLVSDDGERLYHVQVKDAGRRAWNCQGRRFAGFH